MLKPGWLDRQFEKAEKEVMEWPDWMRKGAGITDQKEEKRSASPEKVQAKPESKER